MDLRRKFIDFFKKHDHLELYFPSVLPKQDPTLLFVNSGMSTMKAFFAGTAKPPATRITTAQPCLRVGGKHNDLEMVGKTTRHHTLFEMLGNFSFGDYGRDEALSMAWEFITKELQIDPARLFITVHPKDMESKNVWLKIGASAERILFVDDNIWAAGDVGPRGFCTEIFYDFGPGLVGDKPDIGDTGERYIEIWNIVLMDECVTKDGSVEKLPAPCIDTGMGLERMEAVLSGSHDSYESPIMKELVALGGGGVSARILADHARAIAFLIADGLQPGPCGRNYVLRRLLRRALRHQILLKKPDLLVTITSRAVELLQNQYPRLLHASENIIDIIQMESQKFTEGWKTGSEILENAIKKLEANKVLPGAIVFNLYDTHGFPVDLTESICQERGIAIDFEEFEKEMQVQKTRSKKKLNNKVVFENLENIQDTQFIGYAQCACNASVVGLFNNDGSAEASISGGGWIALNQTPFYAESGGQASDTGFIDNMSVINVVCVGNVWLHQVERGVFGIDQEVKCAIDRATRNQLTIHHTATHLLYASLKKHLPAMTVCSSNVGVAQFKMDISYNRESIEVKKIESTMNEWIAEDLECKAEYMSFKNAQDLGAAVLPGAQYPDTVRVVSIGNIDIELCCGTHVKRTSELAQIKITEVKSIGAKVMRFTAVAGPMLIQYLEVMLKLTQEHLNQIGQDLGVAPMQARKKIALLVGKSIDQVLNEPLSVKRYDNFVYATCEYNAKLKKIGEKLLIDTNLAIYTTQGNGVFIVVCIVKSSEYGNAKEILHQCAEYCDGGNGGGNAIYAQSSIKNKNKFESWLEVFANQMKIKKN